MRDGPPARAVTLLNATTGGWWYGEIYAGGRHLATYSGSTTNFLHADWLGTKRVMTGVSGASSETCTGLPFGDGVNCAGTNWTFNGFTDDIHDSESNLEHTWFRQLSGTQGRWTTPDPYLGSMDLNNPQTLNRYAYVMNNPINLTDPSGLVCGGGDYDDCFFSFLAGAFGGGGNCTMNGIDAPCGFVQSWLNSGVAAKCPNNDCSYRHDPSGWHPPLQVGPDGQWQMWNPGISIQIGTYIYVRPGGWSQYQTDGTSLDLRDLIPRDWLSRPWVFSVILPLYPRPVLVGVGPAGDVEYNPATGNLCFGIGLGASAGHNAAFGPLLAGTSFTNKPFPQNADDILAGLSVSAGYNLLNGLGGQVMANSSGAAYGPTYGIPGGSIAGTYSSCVKVF